MITLRDIEAGISKYLSGKIAGKQLVNLIDDAVSSDDVYEYETRLLETILASQDTFALYVEDPTKRSEHPSFYGPDQLKNVVVDLQRELRSARSKSPR
jgi:hypothetical protein